MGAPSVSPTEERLQQSYALDRLWRETMGTLGGDTKETPLRAVVEVLEATGTAYAVIGGVAMQLHSREPRTTLDIDLAVRRFTDIPRDALIAAGFVHEGRFAHSDNWRAPGSGPPAQRVSVQFSAEDAGLVDAVARAQLLRAGDLALRVATASDLLVLKLAAAEDRARRPSKRRQDLMDVVTLTEEYPQAAAAIGGLAHRVERLTATLMTLGRDRGPER